MGIKKTLTFQHRPHWWNRYRGTLAASAGGFSLAAAANDQHNVDRDKARDEKIAASEPRQTDDICLFEVL